MSTHGAPPPRSGVWHARRFAPLAMAGVCAVTLAGCGSKDDDELAAWPAGEPTWAVQADDPSGATIQLVDAEGAVVRTVGPDIPGGDRNNPDWSPDGSRLTFTVHGNDGRDDLWAADVDGANARLPADCSGSCDYFDDPAWSPDGTTVAACTRTATGDDHVGSLVGVDVETGETRTLFTPGDPREFCAGPRWAPAGDRIVLELVQGKDTSLDPEVTGVTLAIVNLTDEPPAVEPLTDPELFAATADWSPDGSTIVYSALARRGAQAADLFAIFPASKPVRLTTLGDEGVDAVEPSFDAYDTSVVFVSGAELMRVDLDGGGPVAAFETPVVGRHPRSCPLSPG